MAIDTVSMEDIIASASRLGINLNDVNWHSISLPSGQDFGIKSDDEDLNEEDSLEFEGGFGNIIVVDNLPVVPREKFEKLEGVVRKIYSQIGVIKDDGLWMPVDPDFITLQCGSISNRFLNVLQSVPVQAGQTPPLLQYFGTLLTRGKLNAFESLELSRLVVNQNKKNLLENWLAEDKLECTEELGDLVKTVDNDLALKIYIKARATPKVVAAFAERREFDKILIYSKQVGYTPDYLFLLQTILRSDPQGAVNFALMMSQMEGACYALLERMEQLVSTTKQAVSKQLSFKFHH
ncbi:hypothetical protein POM88_054956 [Heracleum sosnowskyi]|uniref:Clathrin heavy chain n=1 Tax=Heracleum sosnowskyi TaxID=360622 RepID=A0AAD8GLF8_9APIA|nr:hypothetical protein POM88_054956 [Heracleum sosnowskyi]